MTRVIVVGMNPSKADEVYTSLKKNSTHDRLRNWMSHLQVEHFSFVNAVQTAGVCKLCDVDLKYLHEATCNYDKVIALGNFVSYSLDRIGVDHFRMPHPSPRNRLLNDSDLETRYLRECKEYLET